MKLVRCGICGGSSSRRCGARGPPKTRKITRVFSKKNPLKDSEALLKLAVAAAETAAGRGVVSEDCLASSSGPTDGFIPLSKGPGEPAPLRTLQRTLPKGKSGQAFTLKKAVVKPAKVAKRR
mmetsp:Transcript_31766/g.72773  ORF Transcript_31766/g.72773 Transcript_31766/m.72773 type:complete len:122 (+) Transcript_31766:1-366(+)